MAKRQVSNLGEMARPRYSPSRDNETTEVAELAASSADQLVPNIP